MVDVIVPVYRPDDKLNRLIHRLNHQTVKPSHVFFMQTITGDEKEDQRVHELLKQADGAVITEVDALSFDHGGTRNQGAAMSKEEFMLFMTQDAVPAEDTLIESMISAMEDPEVATAYGRQLPSREVGIIEHYTRDFNYPAESYVKSAADLERLGIKTYFCSNVCAMYRRSVYEEMGGFVLHTIFNEDMIMAAGVIQAGYKIAYVAEAAVVHAHKYTYRQQFTRNFDLAVSQQQYKEIFENVKSESEGIRLVKRSLGYLIRTGHFWLIPQLIWQSGMKYAGYFLGKRYRKLPRKVVLACTMSPYYWNRK